MSAETAKPVELVYAGKRRLTSGKPGDVYYILNPDMTLGEKMIYGVGKKGRLIGGIYTGALIDFGVKERMCYGLPSITWKGNYSEHDSTTVQGWRGLDHEFDMEQQAARNEKKYRDNVVESLLLVRHTIHNLHKRGAHAEAAAFRNMVLGEIYRPLSKEEKDRVENENN